MFGEYGYGAVEGGIISLYDVCYSNVYKYRYGGGGLGVGVGGGLGLIEIGFVDLESPYQLSGWGGQLGVFASFYWTGVVVSAPLVIAKRNGIDFAGVSVGWAPGMGAGVGAIVTYTWLVEVNPVQGAERRISEYLKSIYCTEECMPTSF